MPIIETKIDRWDGGITNDPRDPRENVARMITNFDIFTNPRKMSPYRDSEDGDSSASTRQLRNFLIARRTGTTYSLYGLGTASGAPADDLNIFYKDLTTGGTGDLDDNGWNSTNNNASTNGSGNYELFVYYRRTGLIYTARGGTAIMAYDPSGTAVWQETHLALTYTNITQGLVHSKDDILYIPYDNFIAANDNGTWNTTALKLPNNYYITSICEFGNNIAIAMAPVQGATSGNAIVGESRVYIWDRNISLTDLSEPISWGDGALRILEVVDGELIGISIGGEQTTRFRAKLLFKHLAGNREVGYRGERFFELDATSGSDGTIALLQRKQVFNERLYFMARAYVGAVQRDGVWSFGRAGNQWSLVHERTPNNDTALSGSLLGFFYCNDYLFQTFGTTVATTKTDDQTTFTAQTAIWESKIYDGSHKGYDASYYKILKELTLITEPLPTAGQVLTDYRVDEDTAWITLFTNTVDNSISHTVINFEGRTATMTIASPAVVTLAGHGLVTGDMFYFTTTGALPTGVSANTTYFVISTGLAADSFRFSATSGGSAVNSSGTQSGTHTLLRRNAALPNDYKQIQFRIRSTGNAEIVNLIFKEDIKPRRYNAV